MARFDTKPITFVDKAYKANHLVPAHDHAWPQLLYASQGMVRIESPKGTWMVPPRFAVWVPPGCVHEAHMVTAVGTNSIYFNEEREWKRQDCEFIEVSPLLRELIIATSMDSDAMSVRRAELMSELIIEEVDSARTAGRPVPMPRDSRLRALFQRILNNPSSHGTLEELAGSVGLTPKTATRLCYKELGMNFRQWRELMHTATATAYFAQGTSVKAVAAMLGYTPSAFSAMMRRSSGTSPRTIKEAFTDEDAVIPLDDECVQ